MEQKELASSLYFALDEAENFIDKVKEEIAKGQYNYVVEDVNSFEEKFWKRTKDLAKKLVEFKTLK